MKRRNAMTYRVMGQMEDGQDYCFADGFRTEEGACKWCDANKHQYPETRLFVERVPTPGELIYGHQFDYA
jgi:hypothetical protein